MPYYYKYDFNVKNMKSTVSFSTVVVELLQGREKELINDRLERTMRNVLFIEYKNL